MDFGEVLLVHVFHVLHTVLLHLLWHDDCGCHTKSPCCFCCCCCILWNLEPLLRICHSTTCKYYQIAYIICKKIQDLWCSHFYFSSANFFVTEHSCVVEMVLLGMPCGLDLIWVACFTVWRHNRCDEVRKYFSARVLKKLFWYQTWLRWSFCNRGFWFCSVFCFYFCCLNQGLQLPKAID